MNPSVSDASGISQRRLRCTGLSAEVRSDLLFINNSKEQVPPMPHVLLPPASCLPPPLPSAAACCPSVLPRRPSAACDPSTPRCPPFSVPAMPARRSASWSRRSRCHHRMSPSATATGESSTPARSRWAATVYPPCPLAVLCSCALRLTLFCRSPSVAPEPPPKDVVLFGS